MDMPADKPRPREKTKPPKKSTKSSKSNQQQMASNDQMPAPSDSSQPPADNSAMSTAAPTPAPPPPPPPPKKFIVDQGTQLTVRLVDPIDSEKNQTGDGFHATLNAPITSDGEEAIPAGTEIRGHLAVGEECREICGAIGSGDAARQRVVGRDERISLQTDQYKKTGSSRGKNTSRESRGRGDSSAASLARSRAAARVQRLGRCWRGCWWRRTGRDQECSESSCRRRRF